MVVSSVPHVYSPVGIIPTHHCEKFLPESYFALISDANPSQPNQSEIEVKPVRLIPQKHKAAFKLLPDQGKMPER